MKASFENSVSVLVRAYMNDTLVHGICTACAVGNLVASALGTEPKTEPTALTGLSYDEYANGEFALWKRVFLTGSHSQTLSPENYISITKEQIDATGYTWEQLARIENAFESADGRPPLDVYKNDKAAFCRDSEWMFNGLMAVVDVLAEIHNVDLTVKEQAIGQFKEVQLSKV